MSKPEAPSPPDFTGAAQATGQSNVVAAIIQRLMGQVGSNTPWGSLSYNQTGTQHIGPTGITSGGMPGAPTAPGDTSQLGGTLAGGLDLSHLDPIGNQVVGRVGDPGGLYGDATRIGGGSKTPPQAGSTFDPLSGPGFDIPTFTSTVTLSPEQQAIFNQQQQNQGTSGRAAGQLLGGLDTSPIDFSGAPALPGGDQLDKTRQTVSDAIYNRSARYLDPQFAQGEDAERTRLANQGFQVGNEGFSRAMGDFNLSKQRAYADARDAAAAQAGTEVSRDFGMGLSSRQQAISEALAKRQLPLNMIAALQGGQQVGMPQFPGAPGGQGIPGTDFAGAAANQNAANMQNYGIQAGQYNSQMGGLYGLGTAGLMAYLLSDRRLKTNVRWIAEHPLGIGVYAFEMGGWPAIGVMADEVERVLPEAVAVHQSGFKMVNYANRKISGIPTVDMIP